MMSDGANRGCIYETTCRPSALPWCYYEQGVVPAYTHVLSEHIRVGPGFDYFVQMLYNFLLYFLCGSRLKSATKRTITHLFRGDGAYRHNASAHENLCILCSARKRVRAA